MKAAVTPTNGRLITARDERHLVVEAHVHESEGLALLRGELTLG
jgi:hypothetical protein